MRAKDFEPCLPQKPQRWGRIRKCDWKCRAKASISSVSNSHWWHLKPLGFSSSLLSCSRSKNARFKSQGFGPVRLSDCIILPLTRIRKPARTVWTIIIQIGWPDIKFWNFIGQFKLLTKDFEPWLWHKYRGGRRRVLAIRKRFAAASYLKNIWKNLRYFSDCCESQFSV